ncbi:MAG: hypothetical protein QM820_47550 [Minicystis sp.]
MPKSDRAFRALARAQPDVIVGLLRVVTPDLIPPGAAPVPDDVAPTQLDGLPPELDADWAARVAPDALLHTECQGYRDSGFSERVLWYHVGFALRHRGKRRVHTVALWLIPPPKEQPKNEVTVDDITVKVTTIVLRDVPASRLLADPATACFAAGADAEGRSPEALCRAVAAALAARRATWPERHMAVVAAATRGRYESMVTAMEQANLEPVVIEDLVHFGEDRGVLKEARSALHTVMALRGLSIDADMRARIDACSDLDTLHRWLKQAVLASNADEALR